MSRLEKYLKELQKDNNLKVIVAVDQKFLAQFGKKVLEEARKATVRRRTAFKHPPHFNGGEYHGHCDLEKGYQVSWTLTGKRLHPRKFPADNRIPKDAKLAVAKVLDISPTILESYIAYDEIENEDVILFELKRKNIVNILLEKFKLLLSTQND